MRLDEKAVDRFFRAVRRRLRRGALEYGDASFARPARDLVAEIEAELHDVAGWAFVLCQRLQKLQRLAVRSDRVGSCGSMEDARPSKGTKASATGARRQRAGTSAHRRSVKARPRGASGAAAQQRDENAAGPSEG